MNNHFELSDLEFEHLFSSYGLKPELFDHEAHLRLAWIHIGKYGIKKAIQNVQLQIMGFVTSIGTNDKYNKTLTIAAVKAVHHFMMKSKSKTFKDFIDEFPRLKNNFKELMAKHYRIDIYNSKKAKTTFLEPDLLPFD